MNPQIVFEAGSKTNALLVDFDRVIGIENSKGGSVPLFLQAIQIKDLKAGEVVKLGNWNKFPRPVLYQFPADARKLEHFPPSYRGILEHAAKVILSLPLCDAGMKITPRNGIKVGKLTLAKGFNEWKLLTAWCWSKWEDERLFDGKAWSFKARWLAMRNQLGYPHTEGAFRKMCSDLELFVTETRKKR